MSKDGCQGQNRPEKLRHTVYFRENQPRGVSQENYSHSSPSLCPDWY